MKTNKELVEKLIEYYLTQDPKEVAKALAYYQIDFNRIYHSEDLPESELHSLAFRIKANVDQLIEFVAKNGKVKNMTFNIVNSDQG